MWRYFQRAEFACHETGENRIQDSFISWLDRVRGWCGFPFRITSGYRSPIHSREVNKPGGPGQHSEGHASDVAVADGVQRRRVVEGAIRQDLVDAMRELVVRSDRSGRWLDADDVFGVLENAPMRGGIGVAQEFVHLDRRDGQAVMWTY